MARPSSAVWQDEDGTLTQPLAASHLPAFGRTSIPSFVDPEEQVPTREIRCLPSEPTHEIQRPLPSAGTRRIVPVAPPPVARPTPSEVTREQPLLFFQAETPLRTQPGSEPYFAETELVESYSGPYSHSAPAPAQAFHEVARFPSLPMAGVAVARQRLASDVSTLRRTLPALRRMVGLPVAPGWLTREADAGASLGPGSIPPPAVSDVTTAVQRSPLLGIAIGVSLVAMILMGVVGISSSVAEAARVARTRTVSAASAVGAPVAEGRVFVDGATRCESLPCNVELDQGEHWITVRARGYLTPPSRSITVGSGEPEAVHFELVAEPEPEPEAEPVATVTPAALPLAARALAPLPSEPAPPSAAPAPARGRSRWSRVEDAAPITPAPAAGSARLNINSIPVSSVVLDGRPMGSTPLIAIRVKPGPHTVVFVAPGGRRVVRGTTVSAGATATVAARL